MIAQIQKGRNTILMDKYNRTGKIHITDIIHAARNDDNLSIELIEEAGEKIGKSIAFLINIFNPEQVIIGGYLAGAGRLPDAAAQIGRQQILAAACLQRYALPHHQARRQHRRAGRGHAHPQ